MREGVGHDVALGLLLDAVIADRRGRVDCLADILLIEDAGIAGHMVCPDAGEEVGLQFHADRELVVVAV